VTTRSLTIAVAALLAAVLGIGAYVLQMRRHALVEVPATYIQPLAPPVSGRTERVTFYVAYDNPGILLPEEASITLPQDRQQRAREILSALVNRYLEVSSPHPMAPAAQVRDVYLVDPGLAVIDLNGDFANGHRSGILVEELTIASLLQTLSANVPALLRVKFLVDGKERDTLAGHADLMTTYDVAKVDRMVSALQAAP
jgi:hypothetical protein